MTNDNREFHQKVKAVFSRTLNIPIQKRSEYLQRECMGDANLQQEVESLLSIDDLDLADDFGVLRPQDAMLRVANEASCPRNYMVLNLLLLAVFTAVAMLANWSLHLRTRLELQQELQVVCDVNVRAIRVWENARSREVEQFARDNRLLAVARQLVQLSGDSDDPRQSLLDSDLVAEFYAVTSAYSLAHGGASLHLVSKDGVVLADTDPVYLGTQLSSTAFKYLAPVFDGRCGVSPLVQNGAMIQDSPVGISEYPTHSYAFAPVPNDSGKVIAALAAMEFSQNGYAQINTVGSLPAHLLVTYIDDGGQIVSSSDETNSEVARPTIRGEAALTQIASAALSSTGPEKRSGFVLDPYVNHRGRRVVGAWSWVAGGSPTGVIIEKEASSALGLQAWLISLTLLGIGCIAATPLVYFAKCWLKGRTRRGLPTLNGRYQLAELIGEGGYSQVFGAIDLQLERKVAVKVLSKRHSKGVSLSRFKREVRILARLTHPSTIRVFDAGASENGSSYFVMELVDGQTLSQLVEQDGQQTEETTLSIIQQVCMSLAEAHDAGLVHRDIKPQNVMVSHAGTSEQFVKVLDFGLGKSTVPIDDEHLSSSGQIAGTIQFMAPECVVSPQQVSPAADVYSIGAVMFYLLTGKPIYEGENKLQLLSQVVEAAWDRSRIPTTLSPQTADSLCLALTKDPTIRPQDASEFGNFLAISRHSRPI